MALSFQVFLEDRQPHLVYVSVVLEPEGGPVHVDGVTVQLFTRKREPISALLLLPIAGTLSHSMVSSVELRATKLPEIPAGSRIVGTVELKDGIVEATCSTDLATELEVHVLGRRALPMKSQRVDLEMSWLESAEYCRLIKRFPWIDACPEREDPEIDVVVTDEAVRGGNDDMDIAEELKDSYGLDDEDARWLKELMDEDDEN